jgi:hypothetical protein
MSKDETYTLGEVSDTGEARVDGNMEVGETDSDIESLLEDMETEDREHIASAKSSNDDIDIADVDPEFKEREAISVSIRACKTCHRQITEALLINGECPICAGKRLREIESKLVQLGAMPQVRKYCALDGHRSVTPNIFLPDYNGTITINGIELYPIFPLCNHCLDTLSAYLIYFLEQRGFSRKGSAHIGNQWADSPGRKLSKAQQLQARNDLQKFIQSIELYVYQKGSPVNEVYRELMKTKKYLMLKAKDKKARDMKAAKNPITLASEDWLLDEFEKLIEERRRKLNASKEERSGSGDGVTDRDEERAIEEYSRKTTGN